MPHGYPDLCCATDDGGSVQCFSQAARIESPATGGLCFVGATCFCGGRGRDGHAYYVQCDPSETPPCSCFIDGVVVSQTTGTCIGTACGFPVPLP
jgi:hypothetical protein